MSNVQFGDELRIVVPRYLDDGPGVRVLWNLSEVERKLADYFGSFVRIDATAGTKFGAVAVAIYDVPATKSEAADNLALRFIGQGVCLSLELDGVYTRAADGTVHIVTRRPAPTISIEA